MKNTAQTLLSSIRSKILPGLAAVALLAALPAAHAQNATWDGGAGAGNTTWGNATNWVGDVAPAANGVLTFSGNVSTSTTNDFTALTQFGNGTANTGAILFTNNGTGGATNAAFALSGNSITLAGDIRATSSTAVIQDTIANDLTISGTRTVTDGALAGAGNHTVLLTGNISLTTGSRLNIENVASLAGAGGTISVASGAASIAITDTGGTVSRAINRGAFGLDIFANASSAIIYNGTYTGTTGTMNLQGNSNSTIVNDFQSQIGGNTTLLKNTANTWKLSNDTNNFTGQLQISDGKFIITSIADKGAASSVGAGTQDMRIGNQLTTGTLDYVGSGHSSNRTVQIGNGNSNTHVGGAIILNNGTGNLTFTSANSTTAFNGGATAATANRTLTLGGNYAGGVNTIQGAIVNNSANGTIGVIKQDNSTWSLNGNNSYTGTTTVSAGTLLINGNSTAATGAVSVAVGATLGGNGTIGGDTTIAGTLSAGNSPGLLTINDSGAGVADLTVQSTANSFFEINGTTRGVTYDAVNVEGALTLGGTLTLNFGFTPLVSNTFDLFDFTSQSGTFSSVVFQNAGYAGSFDAATGVLSLSAIPEPATWALLAGSLTTLVIFRRRRNS